MATQALEQAFQDFETALAASPLQPDPLFHALQALKIPAQVTAPQLGRIFESCYRVLDGVGEAPDPAQRLNARDSGFLRYCAAEIIESALYDRHAGIRAWRAYQLRRYEEQGRPAPEEYLRDDLRPLLTLPWDHDTAARRIAPYLARLEREIEAKPGAHLKLCVNVHEDGYALFKPIFAAWTRRLAERGLGYAATPEVLDQVRALKAPAEDEFIPGTQAFWFFLHEYYDFNPAMVMRLIDAGHVWIAIMCATETPNRVEGMAPALQRLASLPDAGAASAARAHLSRHYGA